MKSAFLSLCAAGLVVGGLCTSGFGAVVYESATTGAADQDTGNTISQSSFNGIRFQITTPTQVNQIGGLFSSTAADSTSIFGALISLTDAADVPDSITLDTPDVILHGLLSVPANAQGDVSLDFDTITLQPGYYGVVFGSGLFGATGVAQMPNQNTAIGSQSAFFYAPINGSNWASYTPNSTPARFYVAAVPEPATAMVGLSIAGLLLRRTRRGR